MLCRHTFANSQDPQIGLQQGRTDHLDAALQKTMTQQGSHMEASKRAGTAYLNMRSNSHEFDLTHKTGSFMYMAPEVFKDAKYNEKVCCLCACVNTSLLQAQASFHLTSCSSAIPWHCSSCLLLCHHSLASKTCSASLSDCNGFGLMPYPSHKCPVVSRWMSSPLVLSYMSC